MIYIIAMIGGILLGTIIGIGLAYLIVGCGEIIYDKYAGHKMVKYWKRYEPDKYKAYIEWREGR